MEIEATTTIGTVYDEKELIIKSTFSVCVSVCVYVLYNL